MATGQAALLMQQDVGSFTRMYERHIEREESELLPMARRLLSDAELDRIGLAMRVRRAVPGGRTMPSPRTPEHSIGTSNVPTP